MGQAVRPFQDRVAKWLLECFGMEVATNMTERCDRALEEHLELLQSLDYDRNRIPALVNYVYDRPVGHTFQEVGGVMVTLSALCSVAGINLHAAAYEELERIERPDITEIIRAKQASKKGINTPLPTPPSFTVPPVPEYVGPMGPFPAWTDGWMCGHKDALAQAPTPEAYDAACKALWKHRAQADLWQFVEQAYDRGKTSTCERLLADLGLPVTDVEMPLSWHINRALGDKA